ncbi:MAG TPA: hypothetical protein PJ986_06375 [Gammaproteobacteria bacterium]|nr:hypothetical protein [Gammaproteobacteria bacterium]
MHAIDDPRGAPGRRALLSFALAALALPAAAAPSSKVHDNVQTRADCALAASRALGAQALVFADPPQAATPRATDIAGEYWWQAFLVSSKGTRTAVWLHCEIVPGSTATYAEVLLRDAAAP